jgi:hypothetical protein
MACCCVLLWLCCSAAQLSGSSAADDDDGYQISPSLAAIGTAPNSVERKLLITSTTLCPFD